MARSTLLEGKVAFITGGAQGIGRAIARSFIDHGGKVVLADIENAKLDATVQELGRNAKGLYLDVIDENATKNAVEIAFSAFGRINTVIPNAGVLLLKPGLETTATEFRTVIDVNLTGAFITSTVFAKRIVEENIEGRVIMTSSLFGTRGGKENSAYSASKFGMIGLMQCLAAELAESGIQVNCVCPGQMNTDMIQQLFRDRAIITGTTQDEVRNKLLSRIPSGQLGDLDHLAGTYVYLASELSKYVTGQAIIVDGGWQIG